MRKTIVSLFVLLTLFSINTFAADYPRQKAVLTGDTHRVKSVSFSPDSRTLASTGWGGVVELWDVKLGKQKAVLTGHTEWAVQSVSFSPDGRTLASAGWDKVVYLWDVASEQQIAILPGHTDWVMSVSFSPDGRTLASGGNDKIVRLWDVTSREIKALLIGDKDTGNINGLAFSPDGSILASSGEWDSRIRLWNVISGKEKTVLTGHTSWGVMSVSFSPDGRTLASGGNDKTVRLWDTISEEQISVFTGHAGDVLSVSFSPDGSTLASASKDKTVRLWDVVSEEQKAVLTGHTDEVVDIAFSPDGSTLASASSSNIHIWDLTTSATTPAVLSISPISIKPLTIGEQLTVSLNIAGGENVAGYQSTVVFDPDALIYFSSANSDYLSDGAFFTAPDVGENYVTLAAADIKSSNGDGTLATITFQVVDVKASRLFLSSASLVDPGGERLFPGIENSIAEDGAVEETVIEVAYRAEDVNDDGVVNIQDLVVVSSNIGKIGENKADVNSDGVVDIVDLVKVAAALGNAAAAPSVHPQTLAMLSTTDVHNWLTQAQHLNPTDIISQRGIRFLEQLLAVLTPKETILLPNYPNPFNPETWIPYRLANSSDVQIIIYDTRGTTVRRLALGHQPAGYYTTRSRAAYWDGRNDLGERVATGVYFYQLQADSMSLLRKMVILK